MKGNLIFSRYSSIFSKNNIYAFYNSLRMKPVFVDQASYDLIKDAPQYPSIDDFLSSRHNNEEKSRIINILEELEHNKILLRPNDDDRIIQHFQNSIKPPYIQIAYFILTEKCNFNCRYCFVKRKEMDGISVSSMSLETAHKALDFFSTQIRRNPLRFNEQKTIIFYGGEPLINLSALEYVLVKIKEYQELNYLPENLELSIITNGSLITDEVVHLLKLHRVSVGISVDGGEFSTNANRTFVDSQPTYEHIKRGIDVCKKHDLPVSLSVTLSDESLADPEAFMDALLHEHSVKSLGFNLLYTVGNYTVSKDYDFRASRFIIDAYKLFRQRNIVEDRMLRKVVAFTSSEVYLFDCAATGGNQIIIAPDGAIGICHGFLNSRKFFITNVDDAAFDPATSSTYQDWNQRTPVKMSVCQPCPALGICGGGCPMGPYENKGSIWELDDRFCVHAKMTLEWLIWDLYAHASASAID